MGSPGDEPPGEGVPYDEPDWPAPGIPVEAGGMLSGVAPGTGPPIPGEGIPGIPPAIPELLSV